MLSSSEQIELKVLTVMVVALMLLVSGMPAAKADGPNRAGLVVIHGDGRLVTACVEFPEAQISGADLLLRSGLDLNTEGNTLGAAVCRIDQEGCTYPDENCFCQCSGGPTCTFWRYWLSNSGEGGWTSAAVGAGNRMIGNGQVDGWVWSSDYQSPPAISFHSICSETGPATLQVSGPVVGFPLADLKFLAAIEPVSTTLPVSYSWQATNQDAVNRSGWLTDEITLSWPVTGLNVITVTAENGFGTVVETYTIAIKEAIPLYLPVIMKG